MRTTRLAIWCFIISLLPLSAEAGRMLSTEPLDCLTPQGWLADLMQAQERNFTGILDKTAFPFTQGGWGAQPFLRVKNGVTEEFWVPYEQTAYYYDGMIRLGYLLDSAPLLDKARRAVYGTIDRAGDDGLLGPRVVSKEMSRWGTGEMIADALSRGCRRIVMGIGGSATNDAGTGLLAALGYRFLDDQGEELFPAGKNLERIARIDERGANEALRETTFTIACDVNNPFYGPRGAAAIYAPQKGASPNEVDLLEKGMVHYARVIESSKHIDISTIPGAGAAGGLGGGILPFLRAELHSGIDIVLEMLRFDEIIRGADLILTGEGKLDRQTGMGKALGGVLRHAQREQVPVIALGGCVEDCEVLNQMGFAGVFSIQPAPVSLQQAMDRAFALQNIRQVVSQIMRTLQIVNHG